MDISQLIGATSSESLPDDEEFMTPDEIMAEFGEAKEIIDPDETFMTPAEIMAEFGEAKEIIDPDETFMTYDEAVAEFGTVAPGSGPRRPAFRAPAAPPDAVSNIDPSLSDYYPVQAPMPSSPVLPYINPELVAAHNEIQQTKTEILESRRKVGFLTIWEVSQMKQVKAAISELDSLLTATPPSTAADYAFGISSVCLSYEKLINACTEYEKYASGDGAKREGRHRLGLSRQLRQSCERELRSFRSIEGKFISGELTIANSWLDVLYTIRSTEIDLSKLETIGDGSSTLYIFKDQNGGISFLKREERMAMSENIIPIVYSFFELRGIPGTELDRRILNIYGNPDAFITDCNDAYFPMTNPRYSDSERPGQVIAYATDNLKAVFNNNDDDLVSCFLNVAKKQTEFKVGTEYARIEPGQTISDRNASTSKVANDLGIGNIVAHSETVMVKNPDGSYFRMNSMEQAVGYEMLKVMDYAKQQRLPIHFSNEAAVQLVELQILDIITGQIDRHQGNYMVQYEIIKTSDKPTGIQINSVKGIDNDLSFGNIGPDLLGTSQKNMIPIIPGAYLDDKGQLAVPNQLVIGGEEYVRPGSKLEYSVPFLPKDLYDKLTDPNTGFILGFNQMDLRSGTEIQAMLDRLNFVRQQLIYLHKVNKLLLIEDYSQLAPGILEKTDSLSSNDYFQYVRQYIRR